MNNQKTAIKDMHVHTHYAYCADKNMFPEESIKKIDMVGIGGIALTEHAAQLYVSAKDYWSARFIEEPSLIYSKENNRMNQFKQYIRNFRSYNVKIGLEVEIDINGNLALLEEDTGEWDVLLGAIHWLPSKFEYNIKQGFLWAAEAIAETNINIMAHPFRFFSKIGETPVDLYKPMVELLKYKGIAAELNFHTNKPDPRFFEMCVSEEIKISFGSDSHCLDDVGQLSQHIDFLKTICGDNYVDVIYKL